MKKAIILSAILILPGAMPSLATIEEAAVLVESGRLDEASAKLAETKDPARFLWQGRIAFLNYNFPEATHLYGQYRKAIGKATPQPEFQMFSRQLELSDKGLESVAEIEVIDSITVDATQFLSAYRLPASAGRLATPDNIPIKGREDIASSVFFNEKGDFALWAEPDTTGMYRITESTRLVDGSWSEPRQDSGILNNNGDTDYPFMRADGTTLYFASDGDESMGGMDLFIATRDPADGTYLRPRNLGMPFNSPYDDFMLAIDEENGVGWWATDRNLLGDRLTIYVYKLQDSRKNVDPDDEDMISLARLSDISLTQNEEEDYTAIRKTLASIRPPRAPKARDFEFFVPGRGLLTNYSDLHSADGKRLMKQYLEAESKFRKDLERLADLREKYHDAVGSGGRNALAGEIMNLEEKEEQARASLKSLGNKLILAETR